MARNMIAMIIAEVFWLVSISSNYYLCHIIILFNYYYLRKIVLQVIYYDNQIYYTVISIYNIK